MKNKIDKYKLIIILIFILGCAVRVFGIDMVPSGLNVDEASAGYDSFAISNYGVDRNGKTMPVFLEAWGSGQNALYTYLMIPFIKILGLSVFSIRFPMAIVGCISLFAMYKILKTQDNKKLTVAVLAFFAIAPWHIMKSRWGLESNMFPDLMLWASYFLISGIQYKKIHKFYIGTVFLGLCSYAYGTSYYFLPIFIIILLVVLFRKKQISIKQAMISLGIITIISLPIILMLVINTFNLPEIKIFNITIPRLASNRYETETLLGSKSILEIGFYNLIKGIKIIITQSDGFIYNSIPYFGLIYLSSLPVMIIGLVKAIKNKNTINIFFNIWALVSITLIPICEPNINRINILWIPLIYYTGVGLYELATYFKKLKWAIIILFIIQFIAFCVTYPNKVKEANRTWNYNLENVITYVDKLENKNIYFEYSIKEPYIYVLFYNKINTNEFINTVKYKNNYKDFDSVLEFGRYRFYVPQNFNEKDDSVIVIRKENEDKYNIDEYSWEKTYIDDYLVLTK